MFKPAVNQPQFALFQRILRHNKPYTWQLDHGYRRGNQPDTQPCRRQTDNTCHIPDLLSYLRRKTGLRAGILHFLPQPDPRFIVHQQPFILRQSLQRQTAFSG